MRNGLIHGQAVRLPGGCKLQETKIERVRVIGPMACRSEVLHALHDAGYQTVRLGPYTDRRMFPQMDDSRFLFIMEREVE